MCCLYYIYEFCFFFFFKQNTEYELRISDWSSDVCSSDLPHPHCLRFRLSGCRPVPRPRSPAEACADVAHAAAPQNSEPSPSTRKAHQSECGETNASDAGRPRNTASRSKCPERTRSEEHTSELQSLMRISYAVFCLKKKKPNQPQT